MQKESLTKINSGRTHLSKSEYFDLMNYYNVHNKKSEKHKEIENRLVEENDFYMLNEYELSLLTGQSLNSIRDNRRKKCNSRFYFIKGDEDKKGKVLYPMQSVRAQLSA
jgi:hypothetical protein